MVLIMSLELVAVSATHLTGVVIYVACYGYGHEKGGGKF